MTKPPRRLLDDQHTAAALRRHLTAAADTESEYDVAAGLSRFEAGLLAASAGGSQTSVGPAPAGAGTASKSLAFKLAWASATCIAVIGAGVYIVAPRPAPVPVRTVPKSEPVQYTDLPPPAADMQASSPSATHEPTFLPPPAAVAPRAKASSAPQTEIARLLRARDLLEKDPKTALSILRELDRDSPHGVLRQERDALTVLAFRNLGELAKARSLAQRFVAHYPDSPMRERLRPLLDNTQDTTVHD